MALILLLASLVSFSLSQTDPNLYWTAQFQQSTAATNAGVNTGTINWNWEQKAFSITFNGGWAETYLYNTSRGYNAVTDGSLSTRSSYSSTCNPECSIALVGYAMPPLAPSLTSGGYISPPSGAAGTCQTYTPISSMGLPFISSFTANGNNICQINFVDGRTFKIVGNPTWTNVNVPTPPGCICDESMDIYILVDHSSSINDPKMAQFKAFVQTFLDSLSISPTGINVGMGWFHYFTGSNFPVTGSRATVDAAMAQWWTNCTNDATISYCTGAGSNDPGCLGCQKSATATSTAIQGYTGATTSPNYPSGQMSVTGAQDFFYNPAYGGSSRKVPKMFLTLTDGAVNHFLNENGGVDGCVFSACTPDLTNAMKALRNRHNSLFSGLTLTTIAMGIGAPGTDPNLSLSPEHLAVLAEGVASNWFTAPSFDSLAASLQNLLLRSCPATNDLVQNTCQQNCCGLCVCGVCKPPTACIDNNLCTNQVLGTCCNPQPVPIGTACPTPNACTNAVCDATVKTGSGGMGNCTYTPVDCSSFTNGCTKYNCNPSDSGKCTSADNSACPPVQCTWGPWGAFQACSVSCGSGTQTQTRTKNVTGSPGYDCAGSNTNSIACDAGCCPVPCALNQWSAWTVCTTCDTGTMTRTQTIQAQPTCSGTPCPDNSQLTQTQNCPACVEVNCQGHNVTTVKCNCATGVKTIQYQVTTPQQGPKSTPCPFADGTTWANTACSTSEINACPFDCVGYWTAWSTCNCNYKTYNRSFILIAPARNGGVACEEASNITQADITCSADASAYCPLYGPACTNDASCADSFACTQDLCLLKPDGAYHCDWSTPTQCNPNLCYSENVCDNSIGCTKVLKSINSACPQPNKCTTAQCMPDNNGGAGGCVVTSVNCTGFSDGCQLFECNTGTGNCDVPNRTLCPPIDCVWGAWSEWSACSLSCGNGTSTITRSPSTLPKDGGAQCVGASSQTMSCHPECCVEDCTYQSWSQWSACASCTDLGNRTRTATINNQASCNGQSCLAVIAPGAIPNVTCDSTAGGKCTWSEACPPCNPRDCVGANNTHGGKCYCSADGFGGYTIITYVVSVTQVTTGAPCPFADGQIFNQSCTPATQAACPIPCIESWTQWSECSCFSSTTTRTYSIQQNASNGGTPCNSTKQTYDVTDACTPTSNCTTLGPLCVFDADCNDELACTIDKCLLVTPPGEFHCNWDGTLACDARNICESARCDNTVGCVYTNLSARVVCPPIDQCTIPTCDPTGNAGAGACVQTPVNCSGYTGSGVDACERYDCDGTSGKCTVPNRTLCPPVPCTWGEWAQWSPCPVTCGNATVQRYRFQNQTAKDGGLNCSATDGNQTQPCVMNGGCCPVDCTVSDWTPWDASQCVVCVPGNQYRNRTIVTPLQCGGECVDLNDTSLSCPPCVPVDCVEQNTTGACNCSQDGLSGNWTIVYSIDVNPVGPGVPCNFTAGTNWTVPCDTSAIAKCPTPCNETWTNYSVCDCFNNSQWQEYIINKAPTNGGVACSLSSSQILSQNCTPAASQNCPNLGPVCTSALDCNDGLACTVDACIIFTPPGTYHCDWSSNLTCNDSSICTSDRCDQILGCVFTPILFCDDQNNCTNDFCDPVEGCQHTNVTCPDLDVCNLHSCNKVTGCGSTLRDCAANLSAILDNCTIAYCDVNYTQQGFDNPCQTTNLCATFSALGVGLGAGILALIIVLAILAALLFGGGVVAAATNIPVMNENAVQLNPLYMGADTGANNPLFADAVENV